MLLKLASMKKTVLFLNDSRLDVRQDTDSLWEIRQAEKYNITLVSVNQIQGPEITFVCNI